MDFGTEAEGQVSRRKSIGLLLSLLLGPEMCFHFILQK